MDSDKIVKLLEYISKRYDVVIGEQAIYTRLYPKDRCIFFQGNSLSENLEKLCDKLLKYSGKQFKEGLEEILND